MSHYLSNQFSLHPSMQPDDIIKLCYQVSYGAEHLLKDVEAAKRYFFLEWESIAAEDKPLYEEISPSYVRLNLSACKYHHIDIEKAFAIFKQSVIEKPFDPQVFHDVMDDYLKTLQTILSKEKYEEFTIFLKEYYQNGVYPIHHSSLYREKENPHYRVVLKEKLQDL